MNKIFIITSAFILFTSPLFASEDHPIDQFESECCRKNWTTAGMANCTYEAQQRWDEELNKNYKQLQEHAGHY